MSRLFVIILLASLIGGCSTWGVGEKALLPFGLILVGGLMGVASMIRMIFVGLKPDVLIFFTIGAAVFLIG